MLIFTMAAVRGILLFVLMLDGVLSLQCPSQKSAEVLIFGAGTAGVTAARILQDNGVTNFKILEANTDRIGGRIRNATFGGVQIELGAQWVEECPENMTTLYGPKVNPIWTLVRDPTKCFVEGIDSSMDATLMNMNLWIVSALGNTRSSILIHFMKTLRKYFTLYF